MTSPKSTAADILEDHVAVLALMAKSAVHQAWGPQAVLHWILPPLARGQYLLMRAAGAPVAYASWAFVNDDAHAKLRASKPLTVAEWKSGPHIWIIDFIAPFGHCREAAGHLRQALSVGELVGKKAHWTRRYVSRERG